MRRRTALKGLAAAGAFAAGARPAAASAPLAVPPDAVGLLYDATKCIGCKACVVACTEANGLEPDRSGYGEGRYQAPVALNARTKNIITLYTDPADGSSSFMKMQCMHCVDPACVRACMLGSLKKREHGIVTWRADLCVGCRYCQVACPFNVPKFEYMSAVPKIVKCELCSHRLAEGKIPACAEVCPRGAVIYGKREELLSEARQRLAAQPSRYVPKIYGEHDGGGTQCLYLSHVPFERLGLPSLGTEPAGRVAQTVQHTIYKGFAAPVALYGALAFVMFRNRKASQQGGAE